MDDHTHFIGKCTDPVTMTPYEFPDIRIFLMRHDAGTRSQFLWKADKGKVLVEEEAGVHGKLVFIFGVQNSSPGRFASLDLELQIES